MSNQQISSSPVDDTVSSAALERPSFWDFACWLLVFSFLAFHLAPVFTDRAMAGWDLVPHYTLYLNFIEIFKQGDLATYDLRMFGGFPEFTLYPPLGYLLLAGPHLVTFGAISPQLSFNAVIGMLPFIYSITLYWCARQFFSRSTCRWALIVGSVYLASPPDFGFVGMGLFSLLWGGLIFGFMAVPMLCIVLGLLQRVKVGAVSSPTIEWLVCSAALAMCALTHVLTTLVVIWFFAAYFLFMPSWRQRIWIISSASAATLACLWWYIPFFAHLPLSSSSTEGLSGRVADPLLIYFPGITIQRFTDLWHSRSEWLSLARPLPSIAYARAISLPAWACYLPIAGAGIMAGIIIGVRALAKRGEFFLVTLATVSMLLLPGNFLADGAQTGIHYYRFIQPLSILFILLAAHGLQRSFNFSNQNSLAAKLGIGLLVSIFGWGVVTNNFLNFSLDNRSILKQPAFHQYSMHHQLFQDQYPNYREGQQMSEYIAALQPRGRIAVESTTDDSARVGSPHFFNSILPQRFNVPVVGGLLVESSPITPLFTPTLSAHSEHLRWGRRDLTFLRSFTDQPLESMIERLRSYSVEYLLASSMSYQQKLALVSPELLQPVKVIGPYQLFRISKPLPYVFSSKAKPALFLGTLHDFRQVMLIAFAHADNLGHPILYGGPAESSELREIDSERFGAIILKRDSRTTLQLNEAQALGKYLDLPVIAFGQRTGYSPEVRWISSSKLTEQTKQLAFHLDDLLDKPSIDLPVAVDAKLSAKAIDFNASGLVGTTLGFAPGWGFRPASKETNPPERVYMSVLGTIYVFANGETRLEYAP